MVSLAYCNVLYLIFPSEATKFTDKKATMVFFMQNFW